MAEALGAVIGVTGAVSCGSSSKRGGATLPRAGSRTDDGTGILARLSRGEKPGGSYDEYGNLTGGDTYGYGNYYGGDYYGYYGGDAYGYYGGDIYGYGYGGDYYGYPYYAPKHTPAPQPSEGYTQGAVPNAGSIEGTVTWKSAPAAPANLAPVKGSGCEVALPNPTLQKAPGGGVAYTLVYLADVSYGKPLAYVGGILEEHECRLAPHAQIAAPIGVRLEVSNQDEIAHAVKVRATGPEAKEASSTRVDLDPMRAREIPLVKAGAYQVTCDSGHPGAVAWVVVPRHPYYAITDNEGRYRFDDVPPGEYTIVAWHEPVITSSDSATGEIRWGEPVEIRGRVKVSASQIARHDIDLK